MSCEKCMIAQQDSKTLLAVARALGVSYEADGHGGAPGPPADLLARIKELTQLEDARRDGEACLCCGVGLQPAPPPLCEECVDTFADYGVDGMHCDRHEP